MKHLKSFSLLLLFFSFCSHGNESHDHGDQTKSKRVTPIVLAVSKVLASVVNVSTERIVTQRYQRFGYTDPFTDFFNRFFGFQHKDYTTSSLGSGVIVDKRGLVLTNNHVIQRASRIIITLSDGSDFVAKPIATDEQNDLALLSLEGISDLIELVRALRVAFIQEVAE